MKRQALILTFAVAFGAAPVAGQTWNLANDWSNLTNPFGSWSLYKNPSDLFTTTQADYWGDGSGQVAWADAALPATQHVPFWMKTTSAIPGVHLFSVPVGTVVMHTSESGRTGTNVSSVRWTSPTSGVVDLLGGTWIRQSYNRPQVWEIYLNGALQTGGALFGGDGTSITNQALFASGSGGAAATNFGVASGDVVELRLTSGSGGGDMIGVDMTVTLTPTVVPEPATSVLLLTGLMGVGVAARRRRLTEGEE